MKRSSGRISVRGSLLFVQVCFVLFFVFVLGCKSATDMALTFVCFKYLFHCGKH